MTVLEMLRGRGWVVGTLVAAVVIVAGVGTGFALSSSPAVVPPSAPGAVRAPGCHACGSRMTTTSLAHAPTSTTNAVSTTSTEPATKPTCDDCSPASTTTTAPRTAATVKEPSTTTSSAPPSLGSCGGGAPPVAAPSGRWTCAFDDEFNESSLDLTKWQPQLTATSSYTTGSSPNQVCYVDNPANISVSGGYLNLSITKAAAPFHCSGGLGFTTSYDGGMVTSYQRFSQTYGYFEVAAILPASTIQGLQETLWLYPESQGNSADGGYGPWPDSGEIDFEESYQRVPRHRLPGLPLPR